MQQLGFNDPNVSNPGLGRRKPEPILEDFSDSRYTTRDANVIFGLYSPFEDGTQSYKGYNIRVLKDGFRNFEILRNRDGQPNINIGLFYAGRVGTFYEMPISTDETNLHLAYEEIKRLDD